MQANSSDNIDSLINEILNGKTSSKRGEAGDVDAILAELVQPRQSSTQALQSLHDDGSASFEAAFSQQTEPSPVSKAKPLAKDKSEAVKPLQKQAAAKQLSDEFTNAFSPVDRTPDRKKRIKNEMPKEPIEYEDSNTDADDEGEIKPRVSLRERMLQVISAMPLDDEYEDEANYTADTQISETDALEAEPACLADTAADADARQTPCATIEMPTLELPALETPTLEFSKQGLKQSAYPNNASRAYVLRPDDDKFPQKAVNPVLANEVDDAFREFFGETVAVDREELEKGLKGKKAGKVLHNLFGARSVETGSFDAPLEDVDTDEESFDEEVENSGEYSSVQDAQSVASTLKNMRSTATLRVIATGLTSLLLLYLGLSSRTGLLPAIPAFDPTINPLLFLCVNCGLLVVTALVSISAVSSGLVGLVKDASCDTMPALAAIAALIQNLYFIFAFSHYSPATVTLLAPIASLLLCANALGQRMHCASVCRSFDMISVGHDHSAAYLVKNREIVERVCSELDAANDAQLLVSRPTSLVKGFVRQSFSSARGEHTAKIMSFILLVFGIIGAIICFSTLGTLGSALTAFAAILCFAAPLASSVLYALPCVLAQRSSARVGAVVPGWSSIEALGSASAVTVGARDLFPASTVRLHGIKTFEKERIDLAILYAASVLIEGCDTLRDIFLGVIENKTDMLYKVESLTQETGYGFTAWIEHSRVILGSRDMMLRHDIEIPSLDYEMKYTKDERCPIYLAVSGKLFGMFLVSYCADDDAYDVAQSLRHSGISMIVRSDDFNISSELIARAYDLPPQYVKVLTGDDRDALAPCVAYLPESEGVMTHIGTFSSFLGGLRAAAGAEGGVKMGSIVQCAAIVLGIIISLLLCFTGGIVSMSLTAIILYLLAWGALTVLMPFLKRY